MIQTILSFVLAFFVSGLMFAQNSTSAYKKGDVFQIGSMHYGNYRHINFPRANFIIKKGGIPNYNNIKGQKVVITSIDKESNGKQVAKIKLVDSRKFFKSHTYVTVNIDEAIEHKELLVVN